MNKEDNVCEETTLTEEFAEAKENGALTVLGKFKDVGALARAYESLQAEFTRRSQRLRQLEKESENFKMSKEPSGAEKLRKAAHAKREEQREFDAFVADMVSPSLEEKKPDEAPIYEDMPKVEGVEEELFKKAQESKEEDKVPAKERFTAQALEDVGERKKENGEAFSSVVGGKAQGFSEDLFERAVKDEGVRLRIIGEYLSTLGKSNAPLTAVGGGTFATPPIKAKTLNEAGNMALLYFKKPVV